MTHGYSYLGATIEGPLVGYTERMDERYEDL